MQAHYYDWHHDIFGRHRDQDAALVDPTRINALAQEEFFMSVKSYFTALVLSPVLGMIGIAQHREGYTQRWRFFLRIIYYYFERNHPDLARELEATYENEI
jgi:hypothetical protein